MDGKEKEVELIKTILEKIAQIIIERIIEWVATKYKSRSQGQKEVP